MHKHKRLIHSCLIVPEKPDQVRWVIHDILSARHGRLCITPNKAEQWLNPELQDRQRIEILMQDFPKNDYEIYPVTVQMNSPKFHGEECIQKLT